jgi:hypothetical protein
MSRSLEMVPELLSSGAEKAMHKLHSANPAGQRPQSAN